MGLVAILVGLMINVQFSNGTGGIAKINSFELQQPSFSQEGIANGIRFQFNSIKRRRRTTERFETEKKIQQASSKVKKEKQISEMRTRENLLSSPCMPDRIIPCVRNSMQQIIQQTYNEKTTQNTTVGESEPVQNQFSNSTVSLPEITDENQIGSSSVSLPTIADENQINNSTISLPAITDENQINNSIVSLPTENQTAIINSQCSIWIKEENSLEALRQAKQLVEMRIKELEPLATKDLPVEAEEMRDTTNSIKSPVSSLGTEGTPSKFFCFLFINRSGKENSPRTRKQASDQTFTHKFAPFKAFPQQY